MIHRLLKVLLWPVLVWRRRLRGRKQACFEAYHKEFLHHVEEGSVVVHVPDFGGSFEIDVRSNILKRILKRGHYEPDLVRIVLEYVDPELDAIDIGANVGFFTILLSKTLRPDRRVLAIEPAPFALKYLHGNIRRNGVAHTVTVYEGVMADRAGNFSLHVIPGKEEYSSVFPIVHPSVTHAAAITTDTRGDTLDNLVERLGFEPGFIKIDAEGAEHIILRGAQETLRRWKPVVLCEVSDVLLSQGGVCARDIIHLLESHDYTVVAASEPSRRIVSPFAGEILAVPRREMDRPQANLECGR